MADDSHLREVIAGVQGRTLASKLRQLMPAIDERVRQGVTHEDLIEALNAEGFSLNRNTFRSNLYRWRKAHRPDDDTGTTTPALPSAKPTVRSAQAPRIGTKDDDADLDNGSPSMTVEDVINDAKLESGGFTDQYMKRGSRIPSLKKGKTP